MMVPRKINIEIFDEEGNRYSITFEGNVTRQKVLGLLDIMELLGGVQDNKTEEQMIFLSKIDKTKFVIKKHFPYNWFSSKDVLNTYEQEFNKPISTSTISTYLARLVDRGFLIRKGKTPRINYRLLTMLTQKNMNTIRNK